MKLTNDVFSRKMYFCFVSPAGSRPIAVYAALLKGRPGMQNLLLDCGVSYNYPDVEQLCLEGGLTPEDIDIVINTHCHADHAGCNQVLKRKVPAIKFWAHPFARPLLASKTLHFDTRPVPYFHFLMEGDTVLDRTLADGEILENTGYPVHILHTPGHSADSISLYLPDDGLLLAGDAIINMEEIPFYEDAAAMYQTLDKLAVLRPKVVLSAFNGLWDMAEHGDLFMLAKQRLDTIQKSVETALAQKPDAAEVDVGQAALDALGIPMPVSPLFLAGIRSHMNLVNSR